MYSKIDRLKDGTLRTVTEFAWLPKRTSNNYYIWLEHYTSFQVYSGILGYYMEYKTEFVEPNKSSS